jgi:hypothetical protein
MGQGGEPVGGVISSRASHYSPGAFVMRFGHDVASPMHDSAYYAIPSYIVADTIKIKFLFLFLPRKENVRDAIGVQYWWSMLSLKESNWGPPSSMLKMVAHLQKSLFILVFCFIFYLGKVGPRV